MLFENFLPYGHVNEYEKKNCKKNVKKNWKIILGDKYLSTKKWR